MNQTLEAVSVSDLLVHADFQPRSGLSQNALDAMREAGREAGNEAGFSIQLYDPIHVWETDGRLYVLAGHHRVALARAAGVEGLSAFVHRGIERAEAVTIAQRSNLSSRPMTPLEEARVYRAALDSGLTPAAIARRFGARSETAVIGRLNLTYLDAEVADRLERGFLPASYATIIGNAAKQGASAEFQRHFAARAATRNRLQPDLFQSLVMVSLARTRGGRPTQSGFDLDGGNADLVAVRDLDESTVEAASLRTGWTKVQTALRSQIRRFDRIGREPPSWLGDVLGLVDDAMSGSDYEVRQLTGEDTVAPDTQTGVEHRPRSRPYLKWVGSKQREAPRLLPFARAALGDEGVFYEPFCGSAAMTLALAPKRAVLCDAELGLITTHNVVRELPFEVSAALRGLSGPCTSDQYHERRRRLNELLADGEQSVEAAALFIFVNKAGFNGLWRVNSKGQCNVPPGSKIGTGTAISLPTESELVSVSQVLKRADIVRCPWQELTIEPGPGDVVFVDPPYLNTFTGYSNTAVPSLESLHGRMSEWARSGAKIMFTYDDSAPENRAALEGLFAGDGWRLLSIDRHSSVSCERSTRSTMRQVLITNIGE